MLLSCYFHSFFWLTLRMLSMVLCVLLSTQTALWTLSPTLFLWNGINNLIRYVIPQKVLFVLCVLDTDAMCCIPIISFVMTLVLNFLITLIIIITIDFFFGHVKKFFLSYNFSLLWSVVGSISFLFTVNDFNGVFFQISAKLLHSVSTSVKAKFICFTLKWKQCESWITILSIIAYFWCEQFFLIIIMCVYFLSKHFVYTYISNRDFIDF